MGSLTCCAQGEAALGFDLAGATPDEMAGFLGEQLIAWGRAFRDAGMTPE